MPICPLYREGCLPGPEPIPYLIQQHETNSPRILVHSTPSLASSPQLDTTDPILSFVDYQPEHSNPRVLVPDTPPPDIVDPIISFEDTQLETNNPRVLIPSPHSSIQLDTTGPDVFASNSSSPLTSLYGPTFPNIYTDPKGVGPLSFSDDDMIVDPVHVEDWEDEFPDEFEDPEDVQSRWRAFEEMMGLVEDDVGSEQDFEQIRALPRSGPRTSSAPSLDTYQDLEIIKKASAVVNPDSYMTSGLEHEEASHFLAALLTLTKERRRNLQSLSFKELGSELNELARKHST
jgi:hypothetical protein